MDESLWKLVAESLGVELEEEFKVQGLNMTFKITQAGIRLFMYPEWIEPLPELEVGILHKTIPIILKHWKPKQEETYYYINLYNACVDDSEWFDSGVDKKFYKNYNCFKTREEAEAKLKKILNVLKND